MLNTTTPLEREILAHFWTSSEPFQRVGAPSCRAAIRKFIKLGLLRYDDGGRVVGVPEALGPYMRALAVVPLPVQSWEVPPSAVISNCIRERWPTLYPQSLKESDAGLTHRHINTMYQWGDARRYNTEGLKIARRYGLVNWTMETWRGAAPANRWVCNPCSLCMRGEHDKCGYDTCGCAAGSHNMFVSVPPGA
jgi:hypothetical protein